MAQQSQGVQWECSECGYLHLGWEPPDVCPECGAQRHAFLPAAD